MAARAAVPRERRPTRRGVRRLSLPLLDLPPGRDQLLRGGARFASGPGRHTARRRCWLYPLLLGRQLLRQLGPSGGGLEVLAGAVGLGLQRLGMAPADDAKPTTTVATLSLGLYLKSRSQRHASCSL
jgi:hypothetical protein